MPTSQFCISLVSCINKTFFIFIGITFFVFSAQASTVAVSLDPISSSKSTSDPDSTQGWEFQVTNPVMITKLGMFDKDVDGLIESHQIGIWHTDNLLPIVSSIVTSGVAAPLIGNFRYADVSPTILLPGNTYKIGAHHITGADGMITNAGSFMTNPDIVYVGGRASPGYKSPGTPLIGFSRFGPNFIFNLIAVIAVEIKAKSDNACLNINDHGVIPVAILGSDTFDVTQIDQTTLSLDGLKVRERGNKTQLCNVGFSNDDDSYDLLCQFEDDATRWNPGYGHLTLRGQLLDQTEFAGTDSICVFP